MEITKDHNTKLYLNQTEFEKKSKVANYFDYIYNYPPKIKLKWDSIDELKGDLLLNSNYGVLEHSIPFMDFLEGWLFNDVPEEGISKKYSKSQYIDGFIDRVNSSNFFLKKTKKIQVALSHIPIFVVLNGQGEIVLSKPSNVLSSKTPSTYVDEKLYDLCGSFDPLVEKKSQVGLFFMNQLDAEKYLKEVARSDFEGTQTVGLAIHCINLGSAYKITREHHPGIDFRFTPDFREVDKLLNKIGKYDTIVENEQQQLRFRPRKVNMFPYFNKLGTFLTPHYSFLQRNEYFKGVPIYIVQLSDNPRNFLVEQYFNAIGCFDTIYSRCIQNIDYISGFGHNWLMQGSLREVNNSEKFENYIFFEKDQAIEFSKRNGRRVARYNGSRTSNFEFIVKKPKIFVYNLEDFFEDWEDKIIDDVSENKDTVETLFKCKANYFISPKESIHEVDNFYKNFKQNPIKNFVQSLDVKYRILKRSVGVLFSIT